MVVQDRSKKTRELLLEAAYRVFVRDGFERAQVDAIAKEAGRTKGAVYAHFENKEHLFLSLLVQRTLETASRFDALVARESDPARFLNALREGMTELSDPAWSILNLELKLYAIRHPSAAKRLRSTFRRIHERDTGVVAQHLAGDSRVTSKLSAMWTIVSAIVLDMNFDPELMTGLEAKVVIGEVFDGLFPSKAKDVACKPADSAAPSPISVKVQNRRSPRSRSSVR